MTQVLTAPTSKSPSYSYLRDQVKQTLLAGRKRAQALVERAKAKTYWQVGQLIDQHIRREKKREEDRTLYGKEVVRRLARDLGTNQAFLYNSLRFARAYPIFSAPKKLTWTHYRALLEIKDNAKRRALAKEAERARWSSRVLETKVQEIVEGSRDGRPKKESKLLPQFIPKRGMLHTHRITAWKDQPLSLDLGFSCYVALSEKWRRQLKDGDIVRVRSFTKVTKLTREDASNLYTYPASVERVIDGDTLWMRIDLGFGFWIRQKLRLRALDCPELNTKAGQRARKFVEEVLSFPHALSGNPGSRPPTLSEKNVKFFPIRQNARRDSSGRIPPFLWRKSAPRISASVKAFGGDKRSAFGDDTHLLITTTKPDKYDRYLTDIWVGEVNLNQLLLEKRLARTRTTVSREDWGD